VSLHLVKHELPIVHLLYTIELLEKKTSKFIPPELRPLNSPYLNPVEYTACGAYPMPFWCKVCVTSGCKTANGAHLYVILRLGDICNSYTSLSYAYSWT